MNILLDSDVLIDFIRGKVMLDSSANYFINPIVYSEVLYGLLHIGKPENSLKLFLEENRIEILSIGANTAALHSKIKFKLKHKGNPLPDNDILVAASCLEHGLILYTFNKKHFSRIDDLKLY